MRAAAVLVLAFAAGCERVPTAPRATDTGPPDPRPAAPKPPAKGPAAKGPADKSPPNVPTFDAAFAEAIEMGRRLDAEEPAATRKALAVLTAAERLEVEDLMGDDLEESAGALVRAGFAAWVGRESRKVALADPAFRATARVLWDGTGPRHLLGMMNSWGAVDRLVRRDAAAHVARGTPTAELDPAVRDAVEHVGGGAWLRR